MKDSPILRETDETLPILPLTIQEQLNNPANNDNWNAWDILRFSAPAAFFGSDSKQLMV